jgi:uncharacterized membrane protein
LATSVASSRTILSAISGGLITAMTLLVSMMLVAVQLASGQFSPRTLRNWLGDPVLRRSVGIVLGTVVFCLMALRSIRDTDRTLTIPTVTVLVAVVLTIVSLIAVIHAVDHVTQNLKIGTVARRLVDDTLATIESEAGRRANQRPMTTPTASPRRLDPGDVPGDAVAVEAVGSGWVQQIDDDGVLDALPSGSTAWIVVVHGGYVVAGSPLCWLHPGDADGDVEDAVDRIRASFALGSARTMQQDIGFGLAQLSDIAIRALSPGINDPRTASDIVVHLGEVMTAIWRRERDDEMLADGERSVHRATPDHAEYLRAAFDGIRRAGRNDPEVMGTIARTMVTLRREVVRRGLPGPTRPIDEYLDELLESAQTDDWLARERDQLARAVDGRGT